MSDLAVLRLGRLAYRWAHLLQRRLVEARQRDEIGDILLVVEHPPTVTLGRGGGLDDLRVAPERLAGLGVALETVERGGRATYHGPGQLVFYPIAKVARGDLHGFVWGLEEAAIRTVARYGIAAGRDPAHRGVWIGREKIAAVGLAVSGGVTYHGLALNVAPDLEGFRLIVPCGLADRGVTSMARVLGAIPDAGEVERAFLDDFAEVTGRTWRVGFQTAPWLRAPAATAPMVDRLESLFRQERLHTVCEAALCPNIGECWSGGTAAFLILGDVCTRACRFCSVATGRPERSDPREPLRVADAAARMGLRHVVLTSVARDDLPDGGAGQFAETIRAVRQRLPGARVEVLIPDFGGSLPALDLVIAAGPDVLNHNLETVPRLYRSIQPRKDYRRALGVLEYAHRAGLTTKSGLMVGLGESRGEIVDALVDLRQAGCDLATIGQYLQPTDRQASVVEYVHPVEFAWYREVGRRLGFRQVAAGPLVRSSYRAAELVGEGSSPAARAGNPPACASSGSPARSAVGGGRVSVVA